VNTDPIPLAANPLARLRATTRAARPAFDRTSSYLRTPRGTFLPLTRRNTGGGGGRGGSQDAVWS
jgi:hypothetical protein